MNTIFHRNYNVTGNERKRLAKAIAEHFGTTPAYVGPPTFAYEAGGFRIDKTGRVAWDSSISREELDSLTAYLAGEGFTAGEEGEVQVIPPERPDGEDTAGLTVSLPLDGFNPDSLERLQKLVDSKAALTRKALGTDRLDVQASDGTVRFPWWDTLPSPEETAAYTAFIAALCKMAKESKRILATEKDVDSEKYAFRGFLLRLGFIGTESKAHRRILLKNLSGSAAFPNKEKADAFSAAQKAKRDAAKAADGAGEVTA